MKCEKFFILGLFFHLILLTGEVYGDDPLSQAPSSTSSKDTAMQSYDIAVVNIDKLLHECKSVKQIQASLETERVKFQEEMKKQEEFFLIWDKKLIAQQKDMKPEEFSEKRKEFDAHLAAVHQKATKRREKLENTFNQAMAKVQETILLLVRDFALKNKYKLVLPRNFIIFREDSLEITDEVMKKLDEKLPFITLDFS
jgi:outer membrane protein